MGGSNREEHDARARTPQAARGRQALRSSRSAQLQRQAVRSLQGPQVRESQRQESFQRLQEVKCHQLISVTALLSSLSCDSSTLMVTYLLSRSKMSSVDICHRIVVLTLV